MGLRRTARLGGGALVVGALIAGCTASDPERRAPEPTEAASSSPPVDPVTLTLAVFGPRPSLEAYDELAEAFTAANPHVSVDVLRSRNPDDVLAAVRSGVDAPDVFLIEHERFPGIVEEELVQPVDGLLAERQVDFGDGYQRSGLTAFAAAASLQCMPHDVSPVVVYYNKDLVDLASLGTETEDPPTPLDGWTWETFDAAARQAARGPGNGVYIEPSLASLAPFVWSAGGEIVDDVQAPTTLTLSEDEPRDALEQVLALVRDPQVTPTAEELEKKSAVARFAAGELAMVLGTRALTPRLRETEGLDFDVMPLPRLSRLRTVSDMTGYCISAGTEHTEAAADLLAFAVSREGATITTRPGYIVPSNLEVANSAVFTQPAQQPESSFIFNEGVRRTQPLPFTPSWPELVDEVRPDLERMFYAPVIDLDELLTGIDEESQAILAPEEAAEEED